ncbi:hypothetical protein [Merismopedia glauca]|uniref:hypothetical protein n=1 Tax=Merismopedia glauca TaxID=292586 RepID=UPI0015E67F25|nr:hypothetical protein [Merismopedia glauca]
MIVDWVFFRPDLSLFLSWGVNLVHTLIQQRRNFYLQRSLPIHLSILSNFGDRWHKHYQI